MAYYSELSPILYQIISERFLRNQKLCKLLYYYPDCNVDLHNSYDYDPISQRDIENTNKLYMDCIFPMPKYRKPSKIRKFYCVHILTVDMNQTIIFLLEMSY